MEHSGYQQFSLRHPPNILANYFDKTFRLEGCDWASKSVKQKKKEQLIRKMKEICLPNYFSCKRKLVLWLQVLSKINLFAMI